MVLRCCLTTLLFISLLNIIGVFYFVRYDWYNLGQRRAAHSTAANIYRIISNKLVVELTPVAQLGERQAAKQLSSGLSRRKGRKRNVGNSVDKHGEGTDIDFDKLHEACPTIPRDIEWLVNGYKA